ncbi:RCC1 domain-containing protein 1-like isoform X1 [Carcharodon carcharias]|uniref:RCC1 domain-containing protein 1-like isoform X1 n=1 Tax=Carcharodon carcharias TaxID=13397 RepID=UPI001B7F703B|nr:RCC1 domain-containing protein 1-like isoform X1 [Carcharodon carcharias]
MAAPGCWFGFGFNRFGQIVNRREREADGKVPEPRPVTCPAEAEAGRPRTSSERGAGGGQCPAGRPPRISPAWSHTACLTGDGSVYFFGFVDGRPWHQVCKRGSQCCTDILSSEKYLLMLWQDRVVCWDIQNLYTGEPMGDATWTRELKEEERHITALPLIPDGYVITAPPFYKPLSPQLRARKLALGSEHAILLSFDWTVYSWGSGRHGQLGHGSVEDEAEPRIVEALHGLAMAEVAAGSWHSVSASVSGDLYVWGWNESGQLGLPTKSCSEEEHQKHSQQKVLSGQGEGTTSLSDVHDTVIKSTNGKAARKDLNVFISIQAFPALLDLPEELEVSKVSCGSRHTAAITRGGKLFTWGWGSYGQLGHGQTDSSDLPRLVEYFVQNHLYVLDVVCGPWNTFVFARQE